MNIIIDNIKFKIKVALLSEQDSTWNSKNFDKSAHLIPYTRLYFPLEGEGYAEFCGRKYHLRPGFMYLIPPFTRTDASCPKRLLKYWTHFNACVLNSDLDIFSLFTPEYEVPVEKYDFCIELFRRLVDIYDTPSEIRRFEAQSALSLLLLPFFKTLLKPTKEKSISAIGHFTRLLIYIEENLSSPLSLKALAKVAHLNPTYLSNLFSAEMGVPLIKYCNNRRISKAISLLWHSDMTVAEVADKVGIPDASNFSKMFKKQTSYSPAFFKKTLPKEDSDQFVIYSFPET